MTQSRARHSSSEHRHVTFNERTLILNDDQDLMSTSLPDLRRYTRRKCKIKECTKASMSFTQISTRSSSPSSNRTAAAARRNQRRARAPHPPEREFSEPLQKQSSIVTIFTIWNSMMGTSMLSMPWGVYQAGPIPASVIMLIMLFICFYSAYLVLKSPEKLRRRQLSLGKDLVDVEEFTDVCYHLIGKKWHYIAVFSAVFAFFGALLVYWILMSGFLYSTGNVVKDLITGDLSKYKAFDSAVVCDSNQNRSLSAIYTSMALQSNVSIWNEATVPIFLGVLMFPALFIDNIVIFAKFNALGTVSVCYILFMGISKLVLWGGISIDRQDLFYYNFFGMFKFSGMLALGLLIHNAIITIFKNNKNQNKNARDLLVAYILTASTYLIIGMIFFLGFPIAKSCISDNILNNLERYDVMTSVARLFLLFQMSTVFPLLAFLFRSTCYSFLFESNDDRDGSDDNVVVGGDGNGDGHREDQPLINEINNESGNLIDINTLLESSAELETNDDVRNNSTGSSNLISIMRSRSAPVERRVVSGDLEGYMCNNDDEHLLNVPLLRGSGSGTGTETENATEITPEISNRQLLKERKKKIFYLILNLATLISCISVAIFFPKIGRLISLVGSICGGIYIFYLPSIIYFKDSCWLRRVYFLLIMGFGLVNVVFQFLQ